MESNVNCREFEAHIPEYLDRMTDPEITAAMNMHRSTCVECARLLKIHEYILATLDSTEPVEAPFGLTEKILAAAENATVMAHPIHHRLKLALPAAAFLLLCGVLAGLAGFILRIPRFDTASTNWTYLFEWPLLVKAWFLGLLTHQWMQLLVSPIYITSHLTVPFCLIGGYIMIISLLAFYARHYFYSPGIFVRAIPARSSHSRI